MLFHETRLLSGMTTQRLGANGEIVYNINTNTQVGSGNEKRGCSMLQIVEPAVAAYHLLILRCVITTTHVVVKRVLFAFAIRFAGMAIQRLSIL